MKHSQLRHTLLSAALFAAIVTIGAPTRAADVTPQSLLDADKNPADWLTYHVATIVALQRARPINA
jgi:hypothetical protein